MSATTPCGAPALVRVRFVLPQRYESAVQDHELAVVPRVSERVELALADGTPRSWTVEMVHHMVHDVVDADVVIELTEPEE